MTALYAALAAVSFPGGNVSDLAKSIAESTKQNVVIQAGANESVKAFEYEPGDLNELARTIFNGSGFRRAPGAEHVFHHGRLGTWHFNISRMSSVANDEEWRRGGDWPADALKDDKVTLHTKSGESISIERIPKLILPKPVQMHWVFDRLAIKAWVTDQPAMDFMNYVAKAVGGRLIQKQDMFVLDINPQEIQRRATTTLALAQQDPDFRRLRTRDQAKVVLSRGIVGALGANQVAALLATPSSSLRFEIGPATRPAVQAYVNSLLRAEQEERSMEAQRMEQLIQQSFESEQRRGQRGRDEDRGFGQVSSIVRRADPRVLGAITIDARFGVRVELLTMDGNGRTRLQRLP